VSEYGKPAVLENNKALVRRALQEMWSEGKVDTTEELLAPDFTIFSSPGGRISGPGAARRFVAENRSAFPDLNLQIEDLIAEDDKVVARFILAGTHKGKFMGNDPTNKRGQVLGISIFRVADGRIQEGWGILDTVAIVEQLGFLPTQAE